MVRRSTTLPLCTYVLRSRSRQLAKPDESISRAYHPMDGSRTAAGSTARAAATTGADCFA